jgi:hypothetical protein
MRAAHLDTGCARQGLVDNARSGLGVILAKARGEYCNSRYGQRAISGMDKSTC